MATNHLGHFMLTLGLLPCLQLATAAATAVPTDPLCKPWPPVSATAGADGKSSAAVAAAGVATGAAVGAGAAAAAAVACGGSSSSSSSGVGGSSGSSSGAGGGGGSSCSERQPFRARVVNVVSAMELLAYDLTKDNVTLGVKGAYDGAYDAAKSYGRSKFAQVGRGGWEGRGEGGEGGEGWRRVPQVARGEEEQGMGRRGGRRQEMGKEREGGKVGRWHRSR